MKSRASLKSHPLHPILVSFPIAFFIGTLGFDLAGVARDNLTFTKTAFNLEIAGILFALLAAIPGIIDFVFVVPPKSSGKKRAAKHGLINVTVVIIFAIAWFYRQGDNAKSPVFIGLEILGSGLLVLAGWMGGTLVYRNQIGVDPRYAGAGKWKEEYIDKEDEAIVIASPDELKLNQMKLVHIKGKRIVIGRTEQGYVAFDDRCTHKGGALAGGAMICATVQCPWHGSQFDVHTGAVKSGPAKDNLQVYALTEKEGKVYLRL
jgi:uncharacterized membrane protein/nitrite reductase/ring-hydroxylating ferredoxin subunit